MTKRAEVLSSYWKCSLVFGTLNHSIIDFSFHCLNFDHQYTYACSNHIIQGNGPNWKICILNLLGRSHSESIQKPGGLVFIYFSHFILVNTLILPLALGFFSWKSHCGLHWTCLTSEWDLFCLKCIPSCHIRFKQLTIMLVMLSMKVNAYRMSCLYTTLTIFINKKFF